MATTAQTRPWTLSRRTQGRLLRFVRQIPSYLVLLAWCGFTVFAIGWIAMSSFKTNRQLFQEPLKLPPQLRFENYSTAWNAVDMGRYFLNSVIVVSVSVFLILAISAPAAYVLSRVKFRGSNTITTLFTAGMGIPYPLLFIPLFALMLNLQLDNTLPGLIVVYVSLSLPFTVYILTGFFITLPSELEDAAVIDGCSDYQVYWRVMLPLASPGLLTAAIFNFIGLWNEYQLALVFANTDKTRTLSLGLYALRNALQYTGDWASLFAGIVIIMLPTVAIYVVLSERMISGITMGSLK
ncbi:MAG: sugar ABC transporter permease [Anaerolineae bacterium]|nr:MAG: sugar ABC transporter permease [Anaerolineae bacterium]